MKTLRSAVGFVSYLLIQLAVLTSCHREEIVPTASFTIGYQDPVVSNYLYQTKIPTYVSLKATDKSTDAVSYQWDFGNGLISAAKEPVFYYEKSGTYTVTFTTTSRTGGRQTSTQNVTILDRVLKRITIPYLRWNALGDVPNWPETKTASVQLKFGYRQPNDPVFEPSQVAFESQLLNDVTPATNTGTIIPVAQRYVFNPYYQPGQLVVNLYGYDGISTVRVFSSAASGGSLSDYTDSKTGQYTLQTGLGGTIIQFEFAYE